MDVNDAIGNYIAEKIEFVYFFRSDLLGRLCKEVGLL